MCRRVDKRAPVGMRAPAAGMRAPAGLRAAGCSAAAAASRLQTAKRRRMVPIRGRFEKSAVMRFLADAGVTA